MRYLVMLVVVILLQVPGVGAEEEFKFAVSQDAWVNEANAGANYGNNTYLSLNDRTGLAEVYLKFSDADLAALQGQTISAASLFLYQYLSSYSPGDAVNAHALLAPWDEASTTWNSKPAYALGNSGSLYLDSGNNMWRQWSGLEDMVSVWQSGPNYGLVLENNTDAKTGELFARFYSSECSNAEYRPYLSVTTVSPEPVSAVLFLVGVGVMAVRVCRKN
ncbi:MAG: DNRLRE domain-containing protein [Candidatus Omnitrophota bacterium]|nr:DNRLRE domain-containing protein [Candidatus Omnitrophota bacterium]